jgi:hypothetical protein
MTDTPTPSVDLLASRLQRLVSMAAASGAPRVWLHETSSDLVSALLELQALREGRRDAQGVRARNRYRAIAREAEDLRRLGYDAQQRAEAICESWRISRRTYFRALRRARSATGGGTEPGNTGSTSPTQETRP